MDAESPIAVRVARATFNLPYIDATVSLSRDDSGAFDYQSKRTHRGEPFRAKSGTLEHWQTARYCLYSADRQGRLYRGEIDHPPWELSPAKWNLQRNTMGEPHNFPLDGEPHLLSAQPITVRAWIATRCDR